MGPTNVPRGGNSWSVKSSYFPSSVEVQNEWICPVPCTSAWVVLKCRDNCFYPYNKTSVASSAKVNKLGSVCVTNIVVHVHNHCCHGNITVCSLCIFDIICHCQECNKCWKCCHGSTATHFCLLLH
jgi:hypothetical protein